MKMFIYSERIHIGAERARHLYNRQIWETSIIRLVFLKSCGYSVLRARIYYGSHFIGLITANKT
jgi:hypothetical protein